MVPPSAIYPYDTESIESLFTYAANHWTRLVEELSKESMAVASPRV
jgi:DNA-binding protein YbaB